MCEFRIRKEIFIKKMFVITVCAQKVYNKIRIVLIFGEIKIYKNYFLRTFGQGGRIKNFAFSTY